MGRQRLVHRFDRAFDLVRHRGAFEVRRPGADGDFAALRGLKYALVVTFRANGEPVPSPVWFALDGDDRLYFRTAAEAAKVRRLGRDPSVLVCPASSRGRPLGPAIAGVARVATDHEAEHAETSLAAAYGFGRAAFERTIGSWAGPTVYVVVRPRQPDDPT